MSSGECRHTGEQNCPEWCTLPQHCVNQVHEPEAYKPNDCPRCGVFALAPGMLSCYCGGPTCPLD